MAKKKSKPESKEPTSKRTYAKVKNEHIQHVELRQSQKRYSRTIEDSDVTLCHGPAGTSKTFTACYTALKMLADKTIKHVILCKPIQESGEKLGFLPGGIDDKIDPFMQSYISNLKKIIGPDMTEKLLDKKIIEFKPLAYMRGDTFDDCLIHGEVIYLENGSMYKIEDMYRDINEGISHNVMSFNILSNEVEPNEMTGIIKSEVDEYLEITTECGSISNVSMKHKFYSIDGIKSACDLCVGDEIVSTGLIISKKIKSIILIKRKTHKYSINVENNHNYFSTGKLLSKNCLMILDEAQNCSAKQLMLFVTRMGKTSKVLITGDTSQYDIPKKHAGLPGFIELLDGIEGVTNFEFTEDDIVRAEILKKIVNRYDEWKASSE